MGKKARIFCLFLIVLLLAPLTSMVNSNGKPQPQNSRLAVSQTPDFRISADPSALPILAAASFSTIKLDSLNGFSGGVNLTATVSPRSFNGPVVSLNATSIILLAGEIGNSNLTVLTTTSTELINYNVTVTANSGSLTHSVIIELVPGRIAVHPLIIEHVPKAGVFTVNITASAVRLTGWQFQLNFDPTILSAHTNVSLGPFFSIGGYQVPTMVDNKTGTVSMGFVFLGQSLWFTGNDTLASITFTVNGDGLSSLHLSNQFFVTARGTTVSVMSLVSKDGLFANINNFFMVANPPHLDVGRAQSATSQITLTSLNSFSGQVTFTTTVAASGTAPTTLPSASLSPNNVTLAASETNMSTLRISTTNSTTFGDYNVNITGTSGTVKQSIRISVSVTDLSPVANFTFSPSIPTVGETVNFDGTTSFDPDGSIRNWVWDFGDFSGIGFIGPRVVHSYAHAGTYVVSLEVTDNAGLTGMIIRGIIVASLSHDVAVSSIDVSSRVVISSELVNIIVHLQNNGLSNETASLSVYYDSHTITTLSDIFLPVPSSSCVFCQFGVSVPIVWDTSGVPPGNYTISATVFLASDQNPSNNRMVDGNVLILPAPVLRVTPSTGALGTKVLVQGYGFPVPRLFANGIGGVVEVTFDDMFMGFAFTNNERFNFTLNVPHANPGTHRIRAIDLGSLARANANFQVAASPSSATLTVSVDLGTIYFPGDTAVVYVATGLNGIPVVPTELLQVLLVKPDGSNTTLPMTAITVGVFKASFTVPSSEGTYSVHAIARMTGPLDSSTFRSFEVKPVWLSPRAQMMMLVAGLTGLVALATVVWRKDIFARWRHD